MGVYAEFADILDYPGPRIAGQVERCVSSLTAGSPEAAEGMANFQAAQARLTLGRLQEIYTNTFDLRPACTPNLGCHLFGDDVRRNVFMAQLKQRMESSGVALGTELPDHLSLVLRLLERQDSEEEAHALAEDCLIPALGRMVEVIAEDGASNPYSDVLRALLSVIRKQMGAEVGPLGSKRQTGF